MNIAVSIASDRIAGPIDVKMLYFILLGRRPENDAVVADRTGLPIAVTAEQLIESDEFKALSRDVLERGRLPHGDHLLPKDQRVAGKWLRDIADLPTGDMHHTWWPILDVLLNVVVDREVLIDAGYSDLLELLSQRSGPIAGKLIRLAPYIKADPDWLLRFHRTTMLASASTGAQDVIALAAELAVRFDLQISPGFATGLDTAYRPFKGETGVTFQDLSESLLAGADAGTVSHWLFHETHYRRIFDKHESVSQDDAEAPEQTASFIDFLGYGDADGLSPHPLFSPYAYRAMNPGADIREGRCFLHYVTKGCFDEYAVSAIFNAEYYLASYPAARLALLNGTHVSALHHFLTDGIFRDAPFSPDFDSQYYRAMNPDVEDAVATGGCPSATWHFVMAGIAENRAPNPYFDPDYYLMRNPNARTEMQRLGIASALEHFLLIGRGRGYKPNSPRIEAAPLLDEAKAVFMRRSRRAYNNIVSRPPDFSRLVGTTPTVSVIVPVFNEIEFTSRFLECAYFAASHFKAVTGDGCEIIVVDNGSTDDTAAVLAKCAGVTSVMFDSAIGFPRAVNAGIKAARGRYVIVANNDIEFAPDVILRTVQRLREHDEIGMLGGLTILPNETLQEAGSFLSGDGSVVGLGRFENPWDQYFQGLRQADYCTGCFIGFRREEFVKVGGLDEDFSPGYYEETDLAFRFREMLNKGAYVDGSIQISHFEHASFSKGRPPTTAYAAIKRNQARFAGKHRTVLRTHPSSLDLITEHGARPSAIGRTRLLIIEDLMPDERLGSGFVRSSQVLAGLTAHGIPYDLMVLNSNLMVEDFKDQRVRVFRNWMPGEEVETVLTRYASRYSHIMVCRLHNLARFASLLEALRHQHKFQVISDTEALGMLRVLESRRLAGQPVSHQQGIAAVRAELDVPVQVSQWIAVSLYEKRVIEEAGFGPVTIIGHNFGDPIVGGRPWAERKRVLAVGSMHEVRSPNYDALMWFFRNVYPRCADVFDQLTLTLVGFWKPGIREDIEKEIGEIKVEFAGVVTEDELKQLYAESRMSLAPTRFAAGIACKVLEPIMFGLPVVMTDLLESQMVIEGAEGVTGMAVGRRDDQGQSFADWIRKLATDEAAWNDVRLRQLRFAEPFGGAKAFEDGLEQFKAIARMTDVAQGAL